MSVYDILKSSRITKICHHLTKIVFLFDNSSKICMITNIFWTMHLGEREHPSVFNKVSSGTTKGWLPPHLMQELLQQGMAQHRSGLCEQASTCQRWACRSLKTHSSCRRGGRSLQQGIGRQKTNLCLPSDKSKA